MRKQMLCLIVILIVANFDLLGQVMTFDENRVLETICTISSDRFEGRQTGLPGGDAAEEWMAVTIANLGLEPAGTEGYFQPFTQGVL